MIEIDSVRVTWDADHDAYIVHSRESNKSDSSENNYNHIRDTSMRSMDISILITPLNRQKCCNLSVRGRANVSIVQPRERLIVFLNENKFGKITDIHAIQI